MKNTSNEIISSAKELEKISSNELLLEKGAFNVILDGKKDIDTSMYFSECELTLDNLLDNNIEDIRLYNLDRFDICIMTAVYNVMLRKIQSGKSCLPRLEISTTEIIRQLKKDTAYRPSRDEIEKINARIEKMTRIRLTISANDYRKNKNAVTFNETDNILNCSREIVKINETVKSDIWIASKIPLLFRYSNAPGINRLRTITPDYFPDVSSYNTPEKIVINSALALRINQIVKKQLKSKTINYEHYDNDGTPNGFLSTCGIYRSSYSKNTQWRKVKSKVHSQICLVLNDYIKKGIIKKYEVNKNGTSISGITVTV